MRPRRDDETNFLNVDLDVESAHDLSPLLAALGDEVLDLEERRHGAPPINQLHLELGGRLVMPKNAEHAVQGFVRLLKGLPPVARKAWKTATRRDLNIGIKAGVTPEFFETAIGPETLADVATLGARIVLTIYAAKDTSARRRQRNSANSR